METKKSNRADLEKKKVLFLQLGLIVSLGLALAAFEWEIPDYKSTGLPGGTIIHFEDDYTSIQTKQLTPPPPAIPKPATEFMIVDNSVEVEDFTLPDFGADEGEINPIYTRVVIPALPDEKPAIENEIFINVGKMPEYPGGEEALFKFLAQNISYPPEAREAGAQGTVYLSFIVEKDGSVSHVKVLRGVGFGCDEEAVRVISRMPKWSPGMQRTMPVRVSFNMPIAFKLKDS
jgi:periplasmic protein TonB